MTKYAINVLTIYKNITAHSTIVFYNATSYNEAVGAAYRYANKKYPLKDGWASHTIQVVSVDQECITNIDDVKPAVV